jgi:hypothetical protein
MPETEAIRQFFRDVADHVAGIRRLPDPQGAAELLRSIANSEPAEDGGWRRPQDKRDLGYG